MDFISRWKMEAINVLMGGGESGDIIEFVSNIEHITREEASEKIGNFLTLEIYASENNFSLDFLNNIGVKNKSTDSIEIPYYNIDNQEVAIHYKKRENSIWEKGSKVGFYGIWKMKEFTDKSYIVIGKNSEEQAQALWTNNIQALMLPIQKSFDSSNASLLEEYEKIYILQWNNLRTTDFIRQVCKFIPFEKIFTINLNNTSPLKIHLEGRLNKEELLRIATKLPLSLYDEYIGKKEVPILQVGNVAEYIQIAEEVLRRLSVIYFQDKLYVFFEGRYIEGEDLIEETILTIKPDIKKSSKKEILRYIQSKRNYLGERINENFSNFKNGLLNLESKEFIEHSSTYFVTCKLEVEYIQDKDLKNIEVVEEFLNSITANNEERKKAILEYIGYCLTFKNDLKCALVLYSVTNSYNNGIRELLKIITAIVGIENVSHIPIQNFQSKNIYIGLLDKLVSIEEQVMEPVKNKGDILKKIIASDYLDVEKRKNEFYTIKPFCKIILGTSYFPPCKFTDEDYDVFNVIPFEREFSIEEINNLCNRILSSKDALNYLANIAIRAYMRIGQTKNMSNNIESKRIIEYLKNKENTVFRFLEDEDEMKLIFKNDDRVKTINFYQYYKEWCQKNKKESERKSIFSKLVLTKYEKILRDGYYYYKKIN